MLPNTFRRGKHRRQRCSDEIKLYATILINDSVVEILVEHSSVSAPSRRIRHQAGIEVPLHSGVVRSGVQLCCNESATYRSTITEVGRSEYMWDLLSKISIAAFTEQTTTVDRTGRCK